MEEDIRTYVSSEVVDRLRLRKLKLADNNLANEIVASLIDHAGGV